MEPRRRDLAVAQNKRLMTKKILAGQSFRMKMSL